MSAPEDDDPETRPLPPPEYVSKVIAAARLGLSIRRVLELSARGLLKRDTVRDPVTERRRTVFLAADLSRLVAEHEGCGRSGGAAAAPDDFRT
jgi:hypothetical protein